MNDMILATLAIFPLVSVLIALELLAIATLELNRFVDLAEWRCKQKSPISRLLLPEPRNAKLYAFVVISVLIIVLVSAAL